MMSDDKDLPFRAEYAKSSRSSCKACKKTIEKDALRMGIMVQSPRFDGKIPNWHHIECFFKKKQLKSTGDVANFHSLRWEDQKIIKDKVVGSSTDETKTVGTSMTQESTDFSVEYAKSSRSVCKQCKEKIMKNDIRISRMDNESDNAGRFGPQKAWHHLDCFVKVKNEFGYSESAEKLPGFSLLSNDDKAMLMAKFPTEGKKRKKKSVGNVAKKPKTETKEEKDLQAQSALIYDIRDNLQKHLFKKDLQLLLEHNNQDVPPGESRILDLIADCMVFGALKHCPECKKGQLKFRDDGYHCTGYLTGWTKCMYFTKIPKRSEFKIPEELAEKFEYLSQYKYVARERLLPSNPETPMSQTSKSSSSSKGPLGNFKVALVGDLEKSKEEIGKLVSDLGGKLVTKIDSSLTCVISTQDEVDKLSKKILNAKKFNVHVVSENFLDEVKKGGAALMMKQNMLCDWGGDPLEKIAALGEKTTARKSKSNSKSENRTSHVVKVTVHGSAYVDHSSGLEDCAKVYEDGKGVVYNAVLNKVDISKGTNAYYKLQVLRSKTGSRCWLFRSWGRVGTTIGGDKLDEYDIADDAVKQFKFYYLEKTGNEWKRKGRFVKQPGLFYPLDIDYGQNLEEFQKAKALKPGDRSVLPKPVQQLVCLIFDVESMKNAMMEFEIDLKKMPLGKLSKKQIIKAYKILTELLQLIQGDKNPTKILDASNRFYTHIPHDFGLKKPTPLDNETIIQSKVEMLDSLLEIEFAYNLLKTGDDSSEDLVDQHYHQLQTDIKILEKTSKEYSCIQTYLSNTHATTHQHYNLELEEVFKIERKGEYEKYKKFKSLQNKKLLWHGSRIANFAGILSQGLRIAPPEAPVTGYMFGKGIYFADMVSKSANYCYANSTNPTGLLLLCEVALGEMYEKTQAEYVEKLPNGKHSTKGLGQTAPNPAEVVITDGVEIPLGKPNKTAVNNSSLLYNEYIIYDVGQVNIKYLLKVNFKFKY